MPVELHLNRKRTLTFSLFLKDILFVILANEQKITELAEENERLKNLLDDRCDRCIERDRADTAKSMRDRILEGLGEKEQPISLSFVRWLIDRIAQEMLEGK